MEALDMKKLYMISAVAFLALAAVSCRMQEEWAPEADVVYKTVTIEALQGADAKTAYEGDKTFSWTAGDQISVYCTDSSKPSNDGFYTFSTTETGASAKFTGSIPVTAEVGEVALFPASTGHKYQDSKYKFHVDADKSLLEHDSADIPMYGTNNGEGGFAFTHLAGAMKFTVNNVPEGVSQVKVIFTANTSKMSGDFEVTGSGPYTWATAGAASSAEKTLSRECTVASHAFTVYLPYTTGTVWGNNTLVVKDFTGGVEGSTLYTNDALGAIPVTRKKVTRLAPFSCDYRSAFGVDWSGVTESVNTNNTYPAIKSMKATMDADYLYLYAEVDPSCFDLTHIKAYYFRIYIGDDSGSKSSYWGAEKYTEIGSAGWSVYNKAMDFYNYGYAGYSKNVVVLGNTAYYELKLARSLSGLVSQTSTPIKIGVAIDDTEHDTSEYNHLNGSVPYGIIPTHGEELYTIPQYVAPTPSTVTATAANVNKTYRESITETVNPERGMYRHNEYFFTGGTVNKTTVTCEDDMSLVLAIIYLQDYMTNATLSDATLNDIRTILGNVRSQGKKVILRFAYNNMHHSGSPATPENAVNPREPETLSIITDHIDALKTIFDDYKDIIYVVQAGFLGTYGEWYYTTTTGTPLFPMSMPVSENAVSNFGNRATVLSRILAKVPNTIQVALRTPKYKCFFLHPTCVDGDGSWDEISAWDGTSDNARLTFHNDALFGGADDMGTFRSAPSVDRNMWKSQSAWQAVGGEVAFLSEEAVAGAEPYYRLDAALQTLKDYHYSYLNDAAANDRIIQYWIAHDQYPIIRKALGYRLVLNNLTITPDGTYESGQSVNFSIKISNVGSASVIYPRPCQLVLLHGSTPIVLKDLTAAHDIRDIAPGGNYTYSFDVTLPQKICVGDKLAIWMPDKTAALQATAAYSIRLSNNDVAWESGYNIIHTF